MKMTLITAAALVVAFAMPAFAANEFYLVQDTATKKCSIVEAKPTMSTMTVVGAVHKTTEAETAMKADKACVTVADKAQATLDRAPDAGRLSYFDVPVERRQASYDAVGTCKKLSANSCARSKE
jgi:hypothetical protein